MLAALLGLAGGLTSVGARAEGAPASGSSEPSVPAEPSPPARPAEPRAPIALATGLAVAGVSFAAGGFLLAGDGGLPSKHAGLAVLHTGLTLAPLAAHGVVGEWGRGAVFSIAPALSGLGMALLLAERPEAPVMGKNKSQRIYPVLITVSVLGSALGIFDAALVDERSRVRVGATATNDFGGAWVEGCF